MLFTPLRVLICWTCNAARAVVALYVRPQHAAPNGSSEPAVIQWPYRSEYQTSSLHLFFCFFFVSLHTCAHTWVCILRYFVFFTRLNLPGTHTQTQNIACMSTSSAATSVHIFVKPHAGPDCRCKTCEKQSWGQQDSVQCQKHLSKTGTVTFSSF